VYTSYETQGPETEVSKGGVGKAYVVIFAAMIAIAALLWTFHVPRIVIWVLAVLEWLALTFDKQLGGLPTQVQIGTRAFQARIQSTHHSECDQLSRLGFAPSFFFGEAFSLFRVLLIYPIFLYLIMLLNGEVADVLDGSLVFGFPVFTSGDRTTYAHPTKLGVKFHTRFRDGTILMTKNFGGKKSYGPTVMVSSLPNSGITFAWTEHQRRVQAMEANGKQVDSSMSFRTYSAISREA
jgi:hypothetical protein